MVWQCKEYKKLSYYCKECKKIYEDFKCSLEYDKTTNIKYLRFYTAQKSH